jgi:hypothetical protein
MRSSKHGGRWAVATNQLRTPCGFASNHQKRNEPGRWADYAGTINDGAIERNGVKQIFTARHFNCSYDTEQEF